MLGGARGAEVARVVGGRGDEGVVALWADGGGGPASMLEGDEGGGGPGA